MIATIASILLQITVPGPSVVPTPDDVVVVARRGKCGVAIANRLLSSKEFNARAAEWAKGTPVRVLVPASSDYRCLAKIMFKLGDRGVTRAEFVDR